MNDQDNDSFEMNASSSSSPNEKIWTNKAIPKRPKVYSSYVQKPIKEQPNSNQTFIKCSKSNVDNNTFIKKPKYNSMIDTQANDINDKSEESSVMLEPIVGLTSFESNNIFILDDNYALVSLDSQTKEKKNSFCFKGKCSVSIVHGFMSIMGYNVKRNLDDQGSLKWHDLYSPETNAFISINNKLNSESNGKSNASQVDIQKHLITLIHNSTDQSCSADTTISKLSNFLSDFCVETTSLFLIRNLNSLMCDYISFIDNFQQVYQLRFKDLKSLNDKDRSLAQLGIYPISIQGYNSVHRESNEERTVCEEILQFNNQQTNENKFNTLNQDRQEMNSQIIMTCGGKDVGKSTFLRCMVNSLLNKYKTVMYLDCDPGQCEYSLGGCITLNKITDPIFGPPHSHINHDGPTRSCYFFGNLSPSDTPSHYLQCIKKCHEAFHIFMAMNKNDRIPLVINTMGWNQGLGLCLLKDILLLFKPTHIVQINHSVEANKNMPRLDRNWLENQEAVSPENKLKNLARTQKSSSEKSFINSSMETDEEPSSLSDSSFSDLYKDINYKLLTLKSSAPYKTQKRLGEVQKRYSAKDHRNLAIIAYFAPLQNPDSYFQSIHNLRPYKVPFSRFGLHCAHAKVEYNQLLRVFNASLVGLCVVDPKHLKRVQTNPSLPGILEPFDAETRTNVIYKCNGFGIIRGVNMETKEFYILSPENPKDLAPVNLLVKGMLNLPYEFFYAQDSETTCPYISLSDNYQTQKENVIGNAPVQRKYLIHQANNQNK